MTRQAIPRFHLVTDDEVLERPDFLPLATSLLQEGGSRMALHVRGPASPGALAYSLADALGRPAREAGAMLLVNDRVDVALASGASGVHLGRRSLSAKDVRRILGGASVIGVSTHADAEIQAAADGGADYIFVGTVYESASHPGRPGRGTEALAQARALPLPAVAIGGIDVGKTPEVVAAGAHGVAVISGVWRDPHPTNALIRYLDALDSATR